MTKQASFNNRWNTAQQNCDGRVLRICQHVVSCPNEIEEHHYRQNVLPAIQDPRKENLIFQSLLLNLSFNLLDEDPVVGRVGGVRHIIEGPVKGEDHCLSVQNNDLSLGESVIIGVGNRVRKYHNLVNDHEE